MGSGEGTNLQVHPKNCRRRGASVGAERRRGGDGGEWGGGEKKTQKVRVYSVCGIFCTASPLHEHFKRRRKRTNGRQEKLRRPVRPHQTEPPLSATESAFRAPNSALREGEEG